MDIEGIIALLIACIQSKLGIPLTAEALCEAAILKIIEAAGIDQVQKILLGLAAEDPDRYNDFLEDDSDIPGSVADNISYTFHQAPIATYMAMDSNSDPTVTAIIKSLEMGGTTIDLVPGPRPSALIDNVPGLTFNYPGIPDNIAESIIDDVYGEEVQVNPLYTWPEIEAQREYYLSLGYSNSEAPCKISR